jgi:hypothetical protein
MHHIAYHGVRFDHARPAYEGIHAHTALSGVAFAAIFFAEIRQCLIQCFVLNGPLLGMLFFQNILLGVMDQRLGSGQLRAEQ